MADRKNFKWSKSHIKKSSVKWDYKTERHNVFKFPECNAERGAGGLQNGAVYYYDRKVISLELMWWSPYEWLDTVAMRKETEERLTALLGGGKHLYYVQQPCRIRGGRKETRKDPYIFFQQYTAISEEPPADEALIEAFNILCGSPIEGEPTGQYKYNRYDQGGAPNDRTQVKLKRRKDRQAALEDEEETLNS